MRRRSGGALWGVMGLGVVGLDAMGELHRTAWVRGAELAAGPETAVSGEQRPGVAGEYQRGGRET